MDGTKRLIDADALMKEHCEGCKKDVRDMCKTDPVCGSMMWVAEAPTVDAVEVIRCKDCINYGVNKPGYGFCEDLAVMRKDCDFCSRGERKDND